MDEENLSDWESSLVWGIQHFLDALRDARMLAPCDACGFPVARAIMYGDEWRCSEHLPEATDQTDYPEIEDEEDG